MNNITILEKIDISIHKDSLFDLSEIGISKQVSEFINSDLLKTEIILSYDGFLNAQFNLMLTKLVNGKIELRYLIIDNDGIIEKGKHKVVPSSKKLSTDSILEKVEIMVGLY